MVVIVFDWIWQHISILVIALPLLAAFLTPLVGKLGRHVRNVYMITFAVLNTLLCLLLGQKVHLDGVVTYVLGGRATAIPMLSGNQLPIRIMLTVDGFSALMAISCSLVALGVMIYSVSFMKRHDRLNKYYALLLLIFASMNGMILTGDMFNLFVFLEVLSLSSAGMIAFWRQDDEAPEAAFKYIVISTIASLFILFAVGMLYAQYGALNIAALSEMIMFSTLDKIALCLLLAGFAMKCGSVPLHMWVPDAYSRSLGGVTALFVVISQVSLYALFRTVFTLYGVSIDPVAIGWVVIAFGLLSMLGGIFMALPQKDIKRLMAFHAISQTGYMLLGVGVGLAVLNDPVALEAYGMTAMNGGIFHIVNHALYKGLLFLTAGAIFYRIGTRNMGKMSGLATKMPLTTVLFVIGAFAIAGIPPFNGFASKFLIYESVFKFNPLLSVVAMIVSILTLASFMKVFYSAFLRKPSSDKELAVKEVPRLMAAGMIFIAALIIIIGLFPGYFLETFIQPATNALINHAGYAGAILP